MADNKRSFLLYCDIIHTVNKLSDEQAGKLFKYILSYVNDEHPVIDDIIIDLVFEPIKQGLKRDLQKYLGICERNKNNGEKGGRPKRKPKKPSRIITNPKNPDGSKNNPKNPDEPDSDSDIDIDNGKDKDKKDADFLTKIIGAFQISYFEIFKQEYTIVAVGKERAAAAKIAKIYKDKYPEAKTDEVISSLQLYFSQCCEVQDDWLQKNMSLPIIVSKFNEINNSIKNGKSKKIRSVASRSAEIDAIIDAVYDAKGLQ